MHVPQTKQESTRMHWQSERVLYYLDYIDLLIELGYIMNYIIQTDSIISWWSQPTVAKDT